MINPFQKPEVCRKKDISITLQQKEKALALVQPSMFRSLERNYFIR